jgi:hypothetical protein
MKKTILFLLIITAVSARAQSLKELLYSGKLKSDSNTVIRKTDDLKSKIDTGTRKPAEPEKPVVTAAPVDSSVKKDATQTDVSTTGQVDSKTPPAGVTAPVVAAPLIIKDSGTAAAVPAKVTPAPAKTNNKIWKEYTDSLVGSMKTDVLPSKKVKKETYYLMVDYEIDTTGEVTITNVTVAPENEYLQDQVKQRILLSPPQLSPVVDSSNKPRKVKRKYNFNITKE